MGNSFCHTHQKKPHLDLLTLCIQVNSGKKPLEVFYVTAFFIILYYSDYLETAEPPQTHCCSSMQPISLFSLLMANSRSYALRYFKKEQMCLLQAKDINDFCIIKWSNKKEMIICCSVYIFKSAASAARQVENCVDSCISVHKVEEIEKKVLIFWLKASCHTAFHLFCLIQSGGGVYC